MDKQTRNLIQKSTQDARWLLESEFSEQLEGTFDILPNGHITPLPGKHLSDEQKIIREKIVAAIAHEKACGVSDAEAVANYLRVASFTALNRFAALKMLEARGLVQECVSKGEQSSGFKEFCGLAPGLAVLPDKGYRLFIESLFDELSTEIRILFDRRDLASLLWPRRKAQEGLFEILNREEISNIWCEDETIGWVYQYFNSSEERKKMRDESAAPRNSRELAVRNQFFTPRYVVAFLTDNTLGRIWYEMRQGQTRLKDTCRYLVRRPIEIFLKSGETAPKISPQEDLSQEELLRQPVYIPHRQIKDPRNIKMLDPACGSMHFGLYAFDLFEIIYEEAWKLECSLGKSAFTRLPEFKPLTETYADKETFLSDVPRMIIEHNIHGIDIDHRATQIAALSLWLRAQRFWQGLGVKASERPRISRSNIVTAEPMPGEKDMLKEFTVGLYPRVLGQLVEKIFDKMKLAGEAGSLLKIEEEIRDEVSKARQQWLKAPKPEQQLLFPNDAKRKLKQQELCFDLSGVTDEMFWEQAEELILDALKAYAEQVENGRTSQRRLFTEDAAHGFAFIDLCRKRYDVVLMNPPFGLSPKSVFGYFKDAYSDTYVDLYACSVTRGRTLAPLGSVGAITSRAFLTTKKLVRWRTNEVVEYIQVLLDLGLGVMDDAFVEACAYVLSEHTSPVFVAFNRRATVEKSTLTNDLKSADSYVVDRANIKSLPSAKILYSVSPRIHALLRNKNVFEPNIGTAREGLRTFDDYRFLRLRWEIPPPCIGSDETWEPLAKGGEFARYYSDLPLLVRWATCGKELAEENRKVNGQVAQSRQASAYYRRAGGTYSKRSAKGFSIRALPAGCIIGTKGPAVLSESKVLPAYIIGWLNSRLIRSLIHIQANAYEFNTGILKRLPWQYADEPEKLANDVLEAIHALRREGRLNEANSYFISVILASSITEIADRIARLSLEVAQTIAKCQMTCDETMDRLYAVDSTSLEALSVENAEDSEEDEDQEDSDEDSESPVSAAEGDRTKVALQLTSYCVGVCVGRWDIHIALDPSLAPKLPDPFDPLPVCPPGMLVGPDGLPAESGLIVSEDWLRARPDANTLPPEGSVKNPTIAEADYPLRISWDGILVDDPGFNGDQLHREDIIRRVREALDLIWKDKAADIEQEACEILNVSDLRTYFRKSFFVDHIKRYSKSRRKAPIYWQLSTPPASYSIWLYYHRFTKDTFYKVLNEFILPKLQFEERELTNARQQYGPSPTANQRKEISARESLVAELKTFKEEVIRTAPLWNPNLNDGVIINFAPLWRLVPQNRSWQKECKTTWVSLVNGEYDWAHLAMHLWPERVIPKCAKDRSLAIAHGLDEVFWEEDEKGKSQPKKVSKETMAALIADRTSPTIKAALEDLLNASEMGSTAGKKRKRKS